MFSRLTISRILRTPCGFVMKRKYGGASSNPRAKRTMATENLPTITLDAREQQLKNLLVDVARFIDSGSTTEVSSDSGLKAKKEPVVLRWAGGWVRDKLLGIESHDIDVAISCMTGEAFAHHLCKFCDVPENSQRHAMDPDDNRRLYTVARNPDKSKHLETTSARLFGLDLDFVNLRKETYTDESRNPEMDFGTAEEDAVRRDATINALFYNLHTSQVEDFTGGLADMRARRIRTPMDPLQTFTDDPLRVLRLVRFASRLDFSIDSEAEEVMGDPRVLDALRLKISRERIGIELQKMLEGKNPRASLDLINRLGLYHAIFTDSTRADIPKPDISNWSAAYQCLDTLEKNKDEKGSIYSTLVTGDEGRYFAWALAALTPWEQVPDSNSQKKNTKKQPPLVAHVAREGFKAPNRLREVITAAHLHRPAIVELKDIVCTKQQPAMQERDRFGMAIRQWEGVADNNHWRLQVLFSILVDVEVRTRNDKHDDDSNGAAETSASSAEEVIAEWEQFLDHLAQLDVMDAPSLKRIINGGELTKALGGIKAGKWMNPALDVIMAWQLRNPGVTDYAGAVEEVRKRKDGLGITGLK
ncbi:hypothetical protein B0H63DRAFT_557752 [Podospora didyma]|uniref:tRNA nucleotidyltransferase n=1 Tax=Podospora didyma TaxID=330526 RepID=A0AAE0U562_9PEZI|nr:hypothetical protein B0H63DRAFT_557752 [Podospora didyma]